jgi:D-xylose transport system substrate-binding protein
MISRTSLAVAAAWLAFVGSFAAMAKDLTVGVSWSNLEDGWTMDDAAIRTTLEAHGAKYMGADAQAAPAKQRADVERLIAQGADVLVIRAADPEAILSSVKLAKEKGVRVIAYGRPIEDPDVLTVAYDTAGAGAMIAKAVQAVKPAGNYVLIKGDKADPESDLMLLGMKQALKPAMDAGKIKIVGETYIDRGKPEPAQRGMEQILITAGDKVDAALAENDAMAAGVVAALGAQGMAGAVAVGSWGAGHSAINRIALGTETVTIREDASDLGKAAAEAAIALGEGKKVADVPGAKPLTLGSKGVKVNAILLAPLAITRDNLNVVVDKGWMTKAQVCAGARPGMVKFCG